MLQARTRHTELMDAAAADPGELRRSLSFIERVNRRLGYTSATIRHLDRLTAAWPAGRLLLVLDIATGSADMPRALCDWADRRRISLRVVGVDRHPLTLAIAKHATTDPRVALLQGDALALPFAEASFDFVLCSMFLHHLSDDEAASVIDRASRIARCGVIIADLLRTRRALAWISLMTTFSSPMVKHDARVSVRQAFTIDELTALARRAGVSYLVAKKHFGHRAVLSGLKPEGESVAAR